MSSRVSCPTCSQPMSDPKSISVCASCHDRLLVRGDIPLASTGEFAAMSPAMAGDLLDAGTARAGAGAAACTWCGKERSEVKKLLSSGTAHICDECVRFCADIMAAELGDDWR